MKEFGYLIFSVFYHIFLLCGIKKDKVCCIMHHDSSDGSNVGMVVQYLKHRSEKFTFAFITREDGDSVKGRGIIKNFIPFFIGKSYHLATSEFILQDDVFMPLSYIKLRKQVKNIQLWHGTGTIKKFGQDANTGRLKILEKRANSSITHLIVNSSKMKGQYSGAFGIGEERVFAYGLPRTDTLFNSGLLEQKKDGFYKHYPQLREKKLILYAPTFRDGETEHPRLALDIEEFLAGISTEYILGLKLHPFVAKAFSLSNDKDIDWEDRIYDFSMEEDLNTLLEVSVMLITDYSSIIFDYCIQRKPMVFFAYDLDSFFQEGRGFYNPYKGFVPGPTAGTTKGLVQIINNGTFEQEKIEPFMKKHYEYLDGKATERIVENIFKR